MINLLSAALMIAAIGLMGAGSFWSIPCLAASFAGFVLADAVYIDLEMLGGIFILVMILGVVYSLFAYVIGWVL